jgi:hypothetical protein
MLARIVPLSIVVAVLVVPPRPIDASELIFNTQDFAPFNYEVNGVVSGPAADVIRRVCTDMKIDCPMRLLPWRRAQQEVVEGKAHAMFVIGWNAERAKWLSFSPPLLNTEYGFFVRDDNPLKFTQNSDVKGDIVGVFGPWNTATSLKKIKADTVIFRLKWPSAALLANLASPWKFIYKAELLAKDPHWYETHVMAPSASNRSLRRHTCRTLTPRAVATSRPITRPATRALSNPTRGASF